MKVLVLAAIALIFSFPAFAQDKGKSEFSHDAEFRLRDIYEINESGSASVEPSHHNGIDERFKLGLGFRANEKFSANLTLLQSSAMGESITEDPGLRGQATGGDEKNFMSVNQAYLTWMIAPNFTMKFGRMNFALADGSLMSVNDYQAQPYAFDGMTAYYELGFGRFQAFAFKYYDFKGPQGNDKMVGATSSDPQGNGYGLEFEFKNLPQWLRLASLNVLGDTQDGAAYLDTTNPITKRNLHDFRFGTALAAQWGWFDVKLDGQGVTGTEADVDSSGAVPSGGGDKRINAYMYQAEFGLTYADFMQSRFYFSFHSDSGTASSDGSAHANTYDGYFYEKHTGSGLMEIVGWGNLSDASAGWTMHPTDYNEVGLDFHMFWKSQSEDEVSPGLYGQNLFSYQSPTSGCASSGSCHSAIGNEVDLYAEHQFDGGLAMLARAGLFMPGATLKDNQVNRGTSIAQFMLQGKMAF